MQAKWMLCIYWVKSYYRKTFFVILLFLVFPLWRLNCWRAWHQKRVKRAIEWKFRLWIPLVTWPLIGPKKNDWSSSAYSLSLALSLSLSPFLARYVRALGAYYMRLTGNSLDCYKYLEPLLNDYRKLRAQNRQGGIHSSDTHFSRSVLTVGVIEIVVFCCNRTHAKQGLLHRTPDGFLSDRAIPLFNT